MTKSRLLIVDDSVDDREDLAYEFRQMGYAVETVGSLASAEAAAKEGGVEAVICDIVMSKDPFDHSGLLVIKMIQKYCPQAIIIVCSRAARRFEQLAAALGAHEVIAKKSNLATTAIEVDNQILRHRSFDGRSQPFSKEAQQILGFVGKWVAVPLAIGTVGSLACWKGRLHFPLLTQTGSIWLAFSLASLFILTVSDQKGCKNPIINIWPPFTAGHRAKLFLLAAMGGGLIYDVVKSWFFGH